VKARLIGMLAAGALCFALDCGGTPSRTVQLTVVVRGVGSVNVTIDGGGRDTCFGSTAIGVVRCMYQSDVNAVADLYAQDVQFGGQFGGWDQSPAGTCSGTSRSCQLTLSSDLGCVAIF
jgi:hypothetical protein